MVPTATTLGRFTVGADRPEVRDALLTPTLCLIRAWDIAARHA